MMETGLDSLAATELASRLSIQTGVELSSTLAFDQPTPRAVADHILQLIDTQPSYVLSHRAHPTFAFTNIP